MTELTSQEAMQVQGGTNGTVKIYCAPGDPSHSRSEDGGSSGTYFIDDYSLTIL